MNLQIGTDPTIKTAIKTKNNRLICFLSITQSIQQHRKGYPAIDSKDEHPQSVAAKYSQHSPIGEYVDIVSQPLKILREPIEERYTDWE